MSGSRGERRAADMAWWLGTLVAEAAVLLDTAEGAAEAEDFTVVAVEVARVAAEAAEDIRVAGRLPEAEVEVELALVVAITEDWFAQGALGMALLRGEASGGRGQTREAKAGVG